MASITKTCSICSMHSPTTADQPSFMQRQAEMFSNPEILETIKARAAVGEKVQVGVRNYFRGLITYFVDKDKSIKAIPDSEKLAKLDADEGILSAKLTPLQQMSFNDLFPPMYMAMQAVATKDPIIGATYTDARAKKILMMHLLPYLEPLAKKIAEVAPKYFQERVSRSLKEKEVLQKSQAIIAALLPEIDDFSKEELQELFDKIQPEKVGDLDKSRFSSQQLPKVEKIVNTLKAQLAEDQRIGEAAIFGFLVGLNQYLRRANATK